MDRIVGAAVAALVGSGNPEAHDYAAGLPDFEVEPVLLEPRPAEPSRSAPDIELLGSTAIQHIRSLVKLMMVLTPHRSVADVLGLDSAHELSEWHASRVVLPWERGYVRDLVASGGQQTTVHRSQSALWYHVQTGLFTEAEALGIFDRYTAGEL